ncbi:MAG TPA: M23 family metallopeptidase [Desulfosporosinus sp.]|nr:M23 family metallopeptidase [Desulfosporosinus sp.]
MNRWKGFISWGLAGGLILLVGVVTINTGCLGTLHFSSPERTPLINKETDQAALAPSQYDRETGQALRPLTQAGRKTELEQGSALKEFPCPVQGSPLRIVGNYYSEAFDNYIFHAGLDYAEPEGTIIRATHEGLVIFSGTDAVLGQKVIVDCGGGWLVTYGGLDNLRVQVGETIETHDALGQVGLFTAAKGESDQPQLHYEVWHGDSVVEAIPEFP